MTYYTPGQLLPYDGPPVTWGTALAIEAVCETVEDVYAGTGVSFGIHEVARLAGVSSQQAGRVLLDLHRRGILIRLGRIPSRYLAPRLP